MRRTRAEQEERCDGTSAGIGQDVNLLRQSIRWTGCTRTRHLGAELVSHSRLCVSHESATHSANPMSLQGGKLCRTLPLTFRLHELRHLPQSSSSAASTC